MKVLLGFAVYNEPHYRELAGPHLKSRVCELAALPSSEEEKVALEATLCNDKQNWYSSATTGRLKPKNLVLLAISVLP